MKRYLIGCLLIPQICLAEVNFSAHKCDALVEREFLISSLAHKSDARSIDLLLVDINGDEECEVVVISQTEDNAWFSIFRLEGGEILELTIPSVETVNDIAPGTSSLYVTNIGLFFPYAKLNGEFFTGLHLYLDGEASVETEFGIELVNLGEVVFESASP